MSNQKVALITGGTDGNGKGTARKLLSEGWRMVIIGRNPKKCNATVTELKDTTQNGQISALTADLSLLSETKRASNVFLAEHKSLDFLFLNANAIAQDRTITSEGFEWNFALGYLSRTLMAKNLENILKATPGSHILTEFVEKVRDVVQQPSVLKKSAGVSVKSCTHLARKRKKARGNCNSTPAAGFFGLPHPLCFST